MTRLSPEHLSLNTATVKLQWSLRQCIEGCARHGFGGISPWRDKLAECGVDEAARMIADHGLTVTGLCRGGMFPAADAAGLQAAIDDNRRAIDEAAAIQAQCVVLVVGGLPSGSKDIAAARRQVANGLATIVTHAQGAGVKLAIEPLHPMYAADRAVINTMKQANDLIDTLAPDVKNQVGLAVDVYHVWWDPDLAAEIHRAAASRLLAFHICDWLVPTTDLLEDRGMMGDGVIDIPRIRTWMNDAGYTGLLEVEIFSSRNWWRRDADEVLRTCIKRLETAI